MKLIAKGIGIFFLTAGVMYMYTVSTDCPATVHRDVKGFGLDCNYRCNCLNNAQCDAITGDCTTGCAPGWMGPACQYRNYGSSVKTARQYYQATPSTDDAIRAIDGNVSTCSRTETSGQSGSTRQWWRAEFHSELYIVGLVIQIPESDIGKFRGFSVEIGNVSESYDICYQHEPEKDGEKVMDVNCVHPLVGNEVKIQLAENEVGSLVLCEVEIYGGRLVSFNKLASLNQVLDYGSFWNASYAVDGRQVISGESQDVASKRTCAATIDGPDPPTKWWNVNLETLNYIQGLSFFGRLIRRTDQYKNYRVLLSSNHSQNFQTIFSDNPSDNYNDYNPKSINFTTPFSGSIIRIERAARILVICEFEVFGECPLGKCGWDCNVTCMCNSQTTGQHKIQGICPYGCSGRWNGLQERCDIECGKTEWGPYCNKTCGNCKGNVTCNVYDGKCPHLCKPGWIPPYCIDECVDGFFGQDCNFTCGNCKYGAICNKKDGECATGCKPGYKTPYCIERCDNGTYGDDCAESCGSCLHGSTCDYVTGACPPGGCEAGFQGANCNSPCNVGSFGFNCSIECGSCKDVVTCNATTGECPRGCHPGWLTQLCNKPCKRGFYGDSCNETCGYCLNNSTCSHVDGTCSRCTAGYQGAVCKTECERGWFGENCESICGSCARNSYCNRTNGACPFGCSSGYTGEFCHVTEQDDSGSDVSAEMIVGVVVGVAIALAVVIVVVVIFRRRSNRRTRSKSSKEQNAAELFTDKEVKFTPNEYLQSTKLVPSSVQEAVYSNAADENSRGDSAIEISRLRAYTRASVKNPSALYTEFQDLPYGLIHDASDASDVKYISKNRYKNMYPYNMNRVILPETPGKPDSTYINASYINGYDVSRKYIASQGALKTTVNDIWRMVWSEKISVIVMLTNCFELGRLKCAQYWADKGASVYGDISTDMRSEDEYTDFKIRTFTCTQVESGEKRTVIQFHYTAWPDKDVPDTAISLVQFWRKVRGHVKGKHIPWLVHCSASVGRTGTFIALDYLFEQGKCEHSINIKDGVNMLRQQRLNMVQTKEQYMYLHEAVTEALDPIGTVYEIEKFPLIFRRLFTEDGTPTQALRDEFDALCTDAGLIETDEAVYYNDCGNNMRHADASLPENTKKSRNPNIIPDDIHRPRLGLAVDGRNDFINAVFVPTYRQTDRFILTQFPLRDTTVDFVRMVWEFDIDTVVLLDETVSGEGVYWPSKEVPKMISPFTAEHVGEVKEEYYTLRTVRYTYRKSEQWKEVRIFTSGLGRSPIAFQSTHLLC